MILHENKNLFRQAVQFTADKMQIPVIYVEKDYWVTFALYTIFHNPIGQDVVFKGGTSLSKCYNMIERFSEDVDLVILRRESETDNKLKSKLKTIGKTVESILPEIDIPEITQKRGMNRKTAHLYSKEFEGNYGQVRDVIILESTWLGYYEPYTTRSIVSFVGNMMIYNGQTAIADANGLLPFNAQVLAPIRTICEKIMSLVRFSYGENPINDLKKKIRHTYDLHQLLQQREFTEFFQSSAFDEMLLKVAQDDVASFRNNNKWLNHHPNEAIIFKSLDEVWSELKSAYSGDFKNLVYGNLPDEQSVLKTLKQIKERIKSISWKISIDPQQ